MRQKIWIIAGVFLLIFGLRPVSAQQVRRVFNENQTETRTAQTFVEQIQDRLMSTDGPQAIHITDLINKFPVAREALQRYHDQVQLGRNVTSKTVDVYRIGETQESFMVLNVSQSTASNPVFDNIDFTLRAQGAGFNIWVETDEITNSHVRDIDVENFREALGDRTPAYPTSGIVANNELIFGNPPDTDGDDVTDVLLVDVRDGRSAGQGYVAGFVWSGDLSSPGNHRDIVYVDTQPGVFQDGGSYANNAGIQATLAHEYQHLIHFRYDMFEETFTNEGLSEWAEVENGYGIRSPSYLSEMSRYNVNLTRWAEGMPNVGSQDVYDDYQRAGHFTHYIADRIGVIATGSITRNGYNGVDGYANVLQSVQAGYSFQDLLADFHTTNYVNDISINPRFGFVSPERQGIWATPSQVYNGTTGSETPATDKGIEPGGVQYIGWNDVTDLSLQVDVTPSDPQDPSSISTRRNRMRVRLATLQGGVIAVQEVSLGNHQLSGAYDHVALVLAHVEPGQRTTRVRYSASWNSNLAYTTEEVQYDDGTAVSGKFFTLSAGSNGVVVTRFEVPSQSSGTTLDKVYISPFFLSQFTNGGQPSDAPRDVVLKVWGDSNNQPGQELFSLPLNDTRAFFMATTSLTFLEVDLGAYADQLNNLPPTIYVGYTEAGTDANLMVVSVSTYNVENVSFIGNTSTDSWTRLWDVTLSGNPIGETVIPIRATFLVPTGVASESDQVLPDQVTLHQNYPNPFNPTTSIRYSLPQVSHVRLGVYDMLGRSVAVLFDGVQQAGTHEASVDASGWTSGLYFYTLESGGGTITKTMVVVK